MGSGRLPLVELRLLPRSDSGSAVSKAWRTDSDSHSDSGSVVGGACGVDKTKNGVIFRRLRISTHVFHVFCVGPRVRREILRDIRVRGTQWIEDHVSADGNHTGGADCEFCMVHKVEEWILKGFYRNCGP